MSAPRHSIRSQAAHSCSRRSPPASGWCVSTRRVDKATLDLEVRFSRRLSATVANGPPDRAARVAGWQGRHHVAGASTRCRAYMFGFAAGTMTETSEPASGGRAPVRTLGAGFSTDELRQVFPSTGDALDFFERRAGVRLSGQCLHAGAGRHWHRPGNEQTLPSFPRATGVGVLSAGGGGRWARTNWRISGGETW